LNMSAVFLRPRGISSLNSHMHDTLHKHRSSAHKLFSCYTREENSGIVYIANLFWKCTMLMRVCEFLQGLLHVIPFSRVE
jgi:hypothetical protein